MRILIMIMIWIYELVQVPENLRGYEAFDSLTHKPKKCYVLLEELRYLSRLTGDEPLGGHHHIAYVKEHIYSPLHY